MERVILHYDMDSFYASIEMRDNPKYKNKPLVVGGGVVTTANYKAREYGIHSAMSVNEAKRLCPYLIVIPVNKEKYIKESTFIQNLILKITNKVEFIALDEGYVDISEIINKFSSKEKFAEIFRKRIYELTRLSCSIGIGINKLTAKIASDINKPNGQYIFNNSEEFIRYISNLKVGILPGVGKKFKELLEKDNIIIVQDIYKFTLKELIIKYGVARGELLYGFSRGIDNREVDYNRKIYSIGNENTYSIPLDTEYEVERELDGLFRWSYNRLKKKELMAKTISLKIKYRDGKLITRSKSLIFPTDDFEILKNYSIDILSDIDIKGDIKLLGISFSNLSSKKYRQLSLIE